MIVLACYRKLMLLNALKYYYKRFYNVLEDPRKFVVTTREKISLSLANYGQSFETHQFISLLENKFKKTNIRNTRKKGFVTFLSYKNFSNLNNSIYSHFSFNKTDYLLIRSGTCF